jgi:hypothetical protein
MANEPRVSFATYNGLIPFSLSDPSKPIEPRALRLAFDLTGTTAIYAIDLAEEAMTAQLGFVQCLYIDNSKNGNALTVTVGISQQVITVKANTQGYFPVLAPQSATFTIVSTGNQAGVIPTIHFLNAPFPCYSWLTQ